MIKEILQHKVMRRGIIAKLKIVRIICLCYNNVIIICVTKINCHLNLYKLLCTPNVKRVIVIFNASMNLHLVYVNYNWI